MKKYFVFSQQEMDFKKSLAENSGKTFTPGTVITGGARHLYTSTSDSTNCRFSDAEYIEIDTSKAKYTAPSMR